MFLLIIVIIIVSALVACWRVCAVLCCRYCSPVNAEYGHQQWPPAETFARYVPKRPMGNKSLSSVAGRMPPVSIWIVCNSGRRNTRTTLIQGSPRTGKPPMLRLHGPKGMTIRRWKPVLLLRQIYRRKFVSLEGSLVLPHVFGSDKHEALSVQIKIICLWGLHNWPYKIIDGCS